MHPDHTTADSLAQTPGCLGASWEPRLVEPSLAMLRERQQTGEQPLGTRSNVSSRVVPTSYHTGAVVPTPPVSLVTRHAAVLQGVRIRGPRPLSERRGVCCSQAGPLQEGFLYWLPECFTARTTGWGLRGPSSPKGDSTTNAPSSMLRGSAAIPPTLPIVATAVSAERVSAWLGLGGALSWGRSTSRLGTSAIQLKMQQHKCYASNSRTTPIIPNSTRATHCICEKETGDGKPPPSDGPLILRFAPSPTGELHVGGARTALLNYALLQEHRRHTGVPAVPQASGGRNAVCSNDQPLAAGVHNPVRNGGGENGSRLILRIEDTDEARSNPSTETALIEDLRWLGIQWDEGPDVGGPRGPYRQSERLEIYWRYGHELLQRGLLYKCFCSKERLAGLRREQTGQGLPPRYDGRCRSLDPQEVERLTAAGIPFALRFRIPQEPDTLSFHDALRGPVTFSLQRTLGDFVCFRPAGERSAGSPQKNLQDVKGAIDGSLGRVEDQADRGATVGTSSGAPLGVPVYNFCAAVDDWLMGVTAVVRGEEHIPNTIAQMLVARAVGAPIPRFCHLPVMLAKEGGKISKRKQGTQQSVSPSDQQLPHLLDTPRQRAPELKSAAAAAGSEGSSATNYTIRALRMRGFHPEAVADCLKGHHTAITQIPGDMMSCLSGLGRSAFCFDEQHLRYAQKKKVLQLVEDPDAEPLVQFFCDIISKADIFACEAQLGQTAVAAPTATAAVSPGGQCGERVAARLKVEDPPLFKFLALAARVMLPQHMEPSVVVRELIESLRSRTEPVAAETGVSMAPKGFTLREEFRAVAAALVESKDLLATFAAGDGVEESIALWGNDGGEQQQKASPTTGRIANFDAWVDQICRQLKTERPKVMRLARIALTGREVGPPLGKLFQLLRAAEVAGLPTCQTESCGQGAPAARHDSLYCGISWLRKQWFQPLDSRLSFLESIIAVP